MKTTFLLCLSILLPFSICAQESPETDNPLGYRIKKNGLDYYIYSDINGRPNFNDARKLNFRVYFRVVNVPTITIDSVKYQLITIPGNRSYINQNENMIDNRKFPRNGDSINKMDFDHNFWIDSTIIDNQANIEYYKYSNQPFLAALTAPFKYRLKSDSAPEALIDGDLNISPAFGWKFRLSSEKPYFLAPFIFCGITTLTYNSTNNSGITDLMKIENASGITYGAGLTFRFDEISPGFLIGFDKGLGDLGSTYIYDKAPWISFSLSYDFFTPKKESIADQ